MSVPTDGTPFSLKSITTGCYLGIEANAFYAGAKATTVACSPPDAPTWFLQKEQDAHYLINASAPNMCLNVAYESQSAGATLQQWSCNGGRSELWVLLPESDGTFSLINKNSELAAGAARPMANSVVEQLASPNHGLAQWEVIQRDSQDSIVRITQDSCTITPLARDTIGHAPTLADETIYNIYVPIYSQSGKLQAVTQDLERIGGLGFSAILIMPIHPIGLPTGNHPAVESPYAVADYYAIAPALGRTDDFSNLVSQAHVLGMKIIMDVVLNHTAWNNPLITQAPHYYVHAYNKNDKSSTIAHAFWFKDVAQLDWKRGTQVQSYMIAMLKWWMKEYGVDGFRFDTADNPPGKDRMIPAKAWLAVGQELKTVNPRVVLLGECTNPDLALRPFNMDYDNYSLQPAIAYASRWQDARNLSREFDRLKSEHPKGMLHTSIMQTWDMDLDLRMYGGPDGTMAAAVFNFTIEGVPMIFAGEEVANDRGGVNTHAAINWDGPLTTRFSIFYAQLGMLRRRSQALRRGNTKWLKSSGCGIGLIALTRSWEGEKALVAINFSSSAVKGALSGVKGDGWSEVTPSGALRPASHPAPPSINLGPWDFAVFVHGLHEGA